MGECLVPSSNSSFLLKLLWILNGGLGSWQPVAEQQNWLEVGEIMNGLLLLLCYGVAMDAMELVMQMQLKVVVMMKEEQCIGTVISQGNGAAKMVLMCVCESEDG